MRDIGKRIERLEEVLQDQAVKETLEERSEAAKSVDACKVILETESQRSRWAALLRAYPPSIRQHHAMSSWHPPAVRTHGVGARIGDPLPAWCERMTLPVVRLPLTRGCHRAPGGSCPRSIWTHVTHSVGMPLSVGAHGCSVSSYSHVHRACNCKSSQSIHEAPQM